MPRTNYVAKIAKLQAEYAAAERALESASPERAPGIRARMASIRRSLAWYDSRALESPSPVRGTAEPTEATP